MWKKFLAVTVILTLLCIPLAGCKVLIKGDKEYKVGDLVEVQLDGEWWNAELLEISEEGYHVSVKGLYETHWLEKDSIRKKVIPLALNQEGAPYEAGDMVQAFWDGDWWQAEILHVAVDQFYYVTYDDFSSQWDEWIPAYKIKDYKKGKIAEGDTLQSFWDEEWWPATVMEVKSGRFFLVTFEGESTLTEQWTEAEFLRLEAPEDEDDEDDDVDDWDDDWDENDDDDAGADFGDMGRPDPNDELQFPLGYSSMLRQGGKTEVEGLLFYSQHQEGEGSHVYYYGNDPDDLTHLIAVEDGEFAGAIIFDQNLYPVHWLFEDVTIAAMWEEADPFNPEAAKIKVIVEGEQLDLTLDIRMQESVEDMVHLLPTVYGEAQTENLQGLLDRIETMGWQGLTVAEAAARASSPHELAMASMLTTASVTTRIIQHIQSGGSALRPRDLASRMPGLSGISTQSIWGDLGDAAVKSVLPSSAGLLWTIGRHLRNLADGAYDGAGIQGPTVGMLLCRGASTVPNYCNHFYLYHTNENLGRCVAICVVTLGCFTEICMPVELSVEEANGFRTVR